MNKIFNKSSELMTELPDKSVDLMVTSPPYNLAVTSFLYALVVKDRRNNRIITIGNIIQ